MDEAQWQSTRIVTKRSWARFQPVTELFPLLSNLPLNKSLNEVQHYCFSYKNEIQAVQLGAKQAEISTGWDLQN